MKVILLKNKKIIAVLLCLFLTAQAHSNIFTSMVKKIVPTKGFFSRNKKKLVALTIVGSVALLIGVYIFCRKKGPGRYGSSERGNWSSQRRRESLQRSYDLSHVVSPQRGHEREENNLLQDDGLGRYSVEEQLQIERQIGQERLKLNQGKNNKQKFNDPFKQDECVLCLGEFIKSGEKEVVQQLGEKEVVQLECEHIFHKTCICGWLLDERKNTCPACRAKVSESFLESLRKNYKPKEEGQAEARRRIEREAEIEEQMRIEAREQIERDRREQEREDLEKRELERQEREREERERREREDRERREWLERQEREREEREEKEKKKRRDQKEIERFEKELVNAQRRLGLGTLYFS